MNTRAMEGDRKKSLRLRYRKKTRTQEIDGLR